MGRPSSYSAKVADAICERIASGESLRAICRDDGQPDRNTVMRWRDEVPEFAAKYARARDLQGDSCDEDIVEVLAEVRTGTLDPQAARVLLAGLQWRASKLAPKKYGERTVLAGDPDAPLQIAEIRRTVVDGK